MAAEDLATIQRQAVEDFDRAEKERGAAEAAARAESAEQTGREDARAIDRRARVASLVEEAETALNGASAELASMKIEGALEKQPAPSLPANGVPLTELEAAVSRARAAREAIAQVGKDWKLEEVRIRLENEAREERRRLEAAALQRRIRTATLVLAYAAFLLAAGGVYLWSQWPERVMWLADRGAVAAAFYAGCLVLAAPLGARAAGTRWNGTMTVAVLAGAATVGFGLWMDDPGRALQARVLLTGLAWPAAVVAYRWMVAARPKEYLRLAPAAAAFGFAVLVAGSAFAGAALTPPPSAVAVGLDWNDTRSTKTHEYFWLGRGEFKGETVIVTVAGVDSPLEASLYALAPERVADETTLVRTVALAPNTELRLALNFGRCIRVLPDDKVRYTPGSNWQSLIIELPPGQYQVRADGLAVPVIVSEKGITITLTPAPQEVPASG